MSKKITVSWEVHEQGEVDIYVDEIEDFTDDEIRDYCTEGVEDQFFYGVRLRGFDHALKQVKEAREASDKDDTEDNG